MTDDEYKATRQRLGTQAEVAVRLGVARSTVADRERGDMVITREAALALSDLAGRGGAGARKRVAPKRRAKYNNQDHKQKNKTK
jgi:transcriptional regulator with XRE-family HTH domain